MKRVIAIEETVRCIHQVCVEIDNEEDIDRALDNVHPRARTLDEWVYAIGEVVPVLWVEENFDGESDGMEYFDDYEVNEA